LEEISERYDVSEAEIERFIEFLEFVMLVVLGNSMKKEKQ